KILERADGIPLFLEELTQTVIEAGNDQPGKIGGPASIDVPMTLHASLMARLERFSDAKAVMQIGAAIGREFSYDLLKSIAEKPEWELRAALDQLAESGLLQRRGTAHETTYLFKHALLQEAAYNSILRHMRPKLHRRIFDVLKQDFPESEKLHPDVLAHHCSEARMIEEAASYWLKAGQYALGRSANVEANDWLHRGLKMVGELPQGEPRYRLELDLCVVLARSFFTTIGYTSEATIQIVERARRVCDLLGEPPQIADAACPLYDLDCRFGRVANCRKERSRQNDAEVELEPVTRLALRKLTHHFEPAVQPVVGLHIGRTSQRILARLEPITRGLLYHARFAAVVRQNVGMEFFALGKILLQDVEDSAMQFRPHMPEDGIVGGFLQQRVLEQVGRLVRSSATLQQAGLSKLVERCSQLPFRFLSDRFQEIVGKLAPNRCSDLHDGFGVAKAFKARH